MSAQDHLGAQWNIQYHGTHPWGGEWMSASDASGEHVGHIRYGDFGGWEHGGERLLDVEYIHVNDAYRGQGVAQALYRGVREHTGQAFLHRRDEMEPAAKRAVAKAAKEDPQGHKVMAWVKGERRIQKYPAR